jgi:hypothetical protein
MEAAVIQLQSPRSQMVLFAHIFLKIEILVGQRNKKIATAVNAECQGEFSACHFKHDCHWIGRTGLGLNRPKHPLRSSDDISRDIPVIWNLNRLYSIAKKINTQVEIIIIIYINCNWVVTRWQWSFNTHTKHETGLLLTGKALGICSVNKI